MRRTVLEHLGIEVIDMWPPTADCFICGLETYVDFGLPVYEDWILPNDWEDEWFGATVCARCYSIFNEKITAPITLVAAQRIACGDFA